METLNTIDLVTGGTVSWRTADKRYFLSLAFQIPEGQQASAVLEPIVMDLFAEVKRLVIEAASADVPAEQVREYPMPEPQQNTYSNSPAAEERQPGQTWDEYVTEIECVPRGKGLAFNFYRENTQFAVVSVTQGSPVYDHFAQFTTEPFARRALKSPYIIGVRVSNKKNSKGNYYVDAVGVSAVGGNG